MTAAARLAPVEMPPGMPSVLASQRDTSNAVSLGILITSSIKLRSSTAGMKPAPMPWILCAPFGSPDSTALVGRLDRDHFERRIARLQHASAAGDACRRCRRRRRARRCARRCRSRSLPPWSIRARADWPGSRTGSVGRRPGFQRAARWPSRSRRPCRPLSASARVRHRDGPGSCAARPTWSRAWSGSADSRARLRRTRGRCRCCPRSARPASDLPGVMRPSASSTSIIETPIRSFTLDSGLKNSSFMRISALALDAALMRASRTSGVLAIVSVMSL